MTKFVDSREYEKSVISLGEAMTDTLQLYAGDHDSVSQIKSVKDLTHVTGFLIITKHGKKYHVQINEVGVSDSVA